MVKVVNIRFRTAGKVYTFSIGDLEVKKGDFCIVETARGQEMGKVVSFPEERDEESLNPNSPLRTIIRVATEEDREKDIKNREKEKEAIKICKEKIRKHELEMKLIDAEYTFDTSKLLFYFTADGRIDFRELVKDLAAVFRTRIELRQIGVRDETKLLGGFGPCGRELCCHSYLSDFVPVSIKMAKEQDLSLNPTKISGVCGRLMCCLKNEEDTYEYLNKKLPGIGDLVADTLGEEGIVSEVNVLRQRVRVLFENDDVKEIREYPAEELTIKAKRKKGQSQQKAKQDKEPDEPLPKELLEEEDFREDKESDSSDPGRREDNGNRKRNRRKKNKGGSKGGGEA